MQIAIKPAKPFAFGTIDGTPIFGLPGNPVSSLVSFEMIARPALRKMMGHPRHHPRRRCVGVADVDFRRQPDGKTHLVRANGVVRPPTGGSTSGRSGRRAAISSRRRRWPTRSWCSATATAWPRAAMSTS